MWVCVFVWGCERQKQSGGDRGCGAGKGSEWKPESVIKRKHQLYFQISCIVVHHKKICISNNTCYRYFILSMCDLPSLKCTLSCSLVVLTFTCFCHFLNIGSSDVSWSQLLLSANNDFSDFREVSEVQKSDTSTLKASTGYGKVWQLKIKTRKLMYYFIFIN